MDGGALPDHRRRADPAAPVRVAARLRRRSGATRSTAAASTRYVLAPGLHTISSRSAGHGRWPWGTPASQQLARWRRATHRRPQVCHSLGATIRVARATSECRRATDGAIRDRLPRARRHPPEPRSIAAPPVARRRADMPPLPGRAPAGQRPGNASISAEGWASVCGGRGSRGSRAAARLPLCPKFYSHAAAFHTLCCHVRCVHGGASGRARACAATLAKAGLDRTHRLRSRGIAASDGPVVSRMPSLSHRSACGQLGPRRTCRRPTASAAMACWQ